MWWWTSEKKRGERSGRERRYCLRSSKLVAVAWGRVASQQRCSRVEAAVQPCHRRVAVADRVRHCLLKPLPTNSTLYTRNMREGEKLIANNIDPLINSEHFKVSYKRPSKNLNTNRWWAYLSHTKNCLTNESKSRTWTLDVRDTPYTVFNNYK